MLRKIAVIALSLAALSACSQSDRSKITNYGRPAHVQCWSGTQLIFDDWSTGRVENEGHSDGFYFVARKTGRLVEVSGNCIIDFGG